MLSSMMRQYLIIWWARTRNVFCWRLAPGLPWLDMVLAFQETLNIKLLSINNWWNIGRMVKQEFFLTKVLGFLTSIRHEKCIVFLAFVFILLHFKLIMKKFLFYFSKFIVKFTLNIISINLCLSTIN